MGLFGERDIHRRPLLFNIPKFNPSNHDHVKLFEISKDQHGIVKKLCSLVADSGMVKARERIRTIITREINEINEIVGKILNL